MTKEGFEFTGTELLKIAENSKTRFHEPSKVAIVAPQIFTHTLSTMFESFRSQDQLKLKTFYTEKEALDWLKNED